MDRELKIAKIRAEQAELEAVMSAVKAVLSNPVVELIGGMTVIEYLLNNPQGNPVLKFGAAKQIFLEAGVLGAVAIEHMPAGAVSGAGEIMGSILKLVPVL